MMKYDIFTLSHCIYKFISIELRESLCTVLYKMSDDRARDSKKVYRVIFWLMMKP